MQGGKLYFLEIKESGITSPAFLVELRCFFFGQRAVIFTAFSGSADSEMVLDQLRHCFSFSVATAPSILPVKEVGNEGAVLLTAGDD